MKVKVLGIQKLDFVPKGKNENERVTGAKLFFCYPSQNPDRWIGYEVDSLFVRASDALYKTILDIQPMSEINPIYEFNGRYPRLVDIQLVK